MSYKEIAIAALEAYRGNSKGLYASTVKGCIKVIQDLPEEDGGISVKDRLPEEHEKESELMGYRHYIASDLVVVTVANSDGKRFVSDDITVNGEWVNYPFPMFDVTHWMPLPEPPKEEK